ncbi:iron (metal) dependent repressor, DtxR family [Chitinophaga costaii]|uniref:Transcriptional regulator MntR n=2 Tax=Chitinophaga costaii TaxID=1335309 RepID=A0A1C4ENM9_9BACT|nr:iron (metal) dependent repressor, DtxR family [Chitinophaga costaii]
MTLTEENYLKALFRISLEKTAITVKDIAAQLELKMPTVNSMIQKLSEKKLVRYEKYKAIELTDKGRRQALHILRKHRLTELFLSEVMGMGWEEVHDIAEQIEHIQSDRFFNRIDEMLGYPKFDPHGEPIPDADGKLPVVKAIPLSSGIEGKTYTLSGVLNHEISFLKFLDTLQLSIGATITIITIQPFDKSMSVVLRGQTPTVFSYTVCQYLLVM